MNWANLTNQDKKQFYQGKKSTALPLLTSQKTLSKFLEYLQKLSAS